MTRAVLYLRVSKKDSSQDTANQRSQLEEVASHRGWQIVQVYEDHESGTKGRSGRKAFDAMFQDARLGKFDLILFWALDRFTREGTRMMLNYFHELDSYNVAYFSLMEQYIDTSNPLARDIVIGVMGAIAAQESRRMSERTKAGLETARRKGKVLGKPSKQKMYADTVVSLCIENPYASAPQIAHIFNDFHPDKNTKLTTRTVQRIMAKEKDRITVGVELKGTVEKYERKRIIGNGFHGEGDA